MKFTWGHGILIFIILFVIATVSFVIFTFSVTYNLVEEDYYPKGLKYGDQIKKIANTSVLSQKVIVSLQQNNVCVLFPDTCKGHKISGSIHIYRPSDERMDQQLPISLDTSNQMLIPVVKMIHGKYLLKIDWKIDATSYYQEETVMIK